MALEMIDSSEFPGADLTGVFGRGIGLHDGEQACLTTVIGGISSGRSRLQRQSEGMSGVRTRSD